MKTLTLSALLVSVNRSFTIYFLPLSFQIVRCCCFFPPPPAFSSRVVDLCWVGLCSQEDFGTIACHHCQPWLRHCEVCQHNVYVHRDPKLLNYWTNKAGSSLLICILCASFVLGPDWGQWCTGLWGSAFSTLPLLALKVSWGLLGWVVLSFVVKIKNEIRS